MVRVFCAFNNWGVQCWFAKKVRLGFRRCLGVFRAWGLDSGEGSGTGASGVGEASCRC